MANGKPMRISAYCHLLVLIGLLRAAVEAEHMTPLFGLTTSILCNPKIIASVFVITDNLSSILFYKTPLNSSALVHTVLTCPLLGSYIIM